MKLSDIAQSKAFHRITYHITYGQLLLLDIAKHGDQRAAHDHQKRTGNIEPRYQRTDKASRKYRVENERGRSERGNHGRL